MEAGRGQPARHVAQLLADAGCVHQQQHGRQGAAFRPDEKVSMARPGHDVDCGFMHDRSSAGQASSRGRAAGNPLAGAAPESGAAAGGLQGGNGPGAARSRAVRLAAMQEGPLPNLRAIPRHGLPGDSMTAKLVAVTFDLDAPAAWR